MTETDIPIWRYMDLAKYVSVLARGLFFCQPVGFEDIWEGGWGEMDVRAFRERNSGNADIVQSSWNSTYGKKQNDLSLYGINCWHVNANESAALWKLYVPQGLGVAIRSTPIRVVESVAGDGRDVGIHRVTYAGHSAAELGDDPVTLLTRKRREFQHENELRFLITIRDDERDAMNTLVTHLEHRTNRHFPATGTAPLALGLPGFASHDSTIIKRVAPNGVHLQTDSERLIEQVVLAPGAPWPLRRAVIDVTTRFGLNRQIVSDASIDQIPYDHIRFHDP